MKAKHAKRNSRGSIIAVPPLHKQDDGEEREEGERRRRKKKREHAGLGSRSALIPNNFRLIPGYFPARCRRHLNP